MRKFLKSPFERFSRPSESMNTSPNLVNAPQPSNSENQDGATPVYQFVLCVGKDPKENEDAEPICLIREGKGLISVFDGMGGAGSSIYRNREGESHTGAYFASRLTRDITDRHFDYLDKNRPFAINTETLKELKNALVGHLKKKLSEFEKNPSRIKSSLSRKLPTTLASIYFSVDKDCKVDIVWAGDSRAYLLDVDGLQQVSRDDIKTTSDEYYDMTQDAPLSNCISADSDFELRHLSFSTKLPAILLVATDGCYGYVNTPAHFEHLLIDTLLRSKDDQEWGENISAALMSVSSDDFSMALVCFGWGKFENIKNTFRNRLKAVSEIIVPVDEILNKLDLLDLKIQSYKEERENYLSKKKEVYSEFWSSYKLTYGKRLVGDE
jgi:serine/threonine protein phosphatase PrpC